jgi:hypothetical protein
LRRLANGFSAPGRAECGRSTGQADAPSPADAALSRLAQRLRGLEPGFERAISITPS